MINQPQSPALSRPIAATIAVVIRNDQVLLVRRANPPDAGKWGFPGGKIEQGEKLADAALRELKEETGISADILRVFTATDAFEQDEHGHIQRHFILIAVLCRWNHGEPMAGDDALEARWFPISNLATSGLELSLDVTEVAQQAAQVMSECYQ
ncbi:NUDIX hydrolase [Thalassospira sp. MCCC 1A01428]|uniref:NUDIX hydrolase n=1 Tax=Thalassospira sp. MCCC 1A01428 TaxID=1470575 RepID=UPI000A1DF10D|nr:NUDIX hydrolase [Thalassospira sp. MCCC 1A01428]OSQ41811.1 ADP-ribose pyrophosphatase [Thalassospira sp. MCCC 1A01428]